MACARCDFYVPKDSARGQWLETRNGLLKMLQEIPLSDEECAAVEGDVQALNRLLDRLKGVPPPSQGHTDSVSKSSQAFIPINDVSSVRKPSLVRTRTKEVHDNG
jgi:hypothetical protein